MEIVRSNTAFADLIGMDIRDVAGKKYCELVSDGSVPHACCKYKVCDEKRFITQEVIVKGRRYNLTLSPVLNDEGGICAYLHIMEDITDRKAAEERSREEGRVTAALLDVAVAVSSLTGINEIMSRVSAVCHMVFESSSCITYLFDDKDQSFKSVASTGISKSMNSFVSTYKLYPNDMPLLRGLMKDKKVFLIEDVKRSNLVNPEFLELLGTSALMVAPIVNMGQVLGVFFVNYDKPKTFGQREVTILHGISQQVSVALANARKYLEVEETLDATVLSLSKSAEFRDPETGFHLERMSHYSMMLAKECLKGDIYDVKEQFVRDILKASILHDIGKVGIKDVILLKPGKMTAEEFDEMKKHTTMGGQIIEAMAKRVKMKSFLPMAIEIACSHHEKYNGTGYPKGLKGKEIPLSARIVALADFYDALTSHRVYRDWVKTHDEVKAMIIEEKGKHFDPALVEAFLTREDDFIQINKQFPDK